MAEVATIARPYARAAFEYAQDAKALARWGDLLDIGAAVAADPGFGALIGNPKVADDALADLVLGIAGDKADAHGRNFVQLLAQNRRLALLPEIARQYALLRAAAENTVDVEITSAMPLTPEQTEKFARALTRRLNRVVRLHPQVDPSLIGGAIVRSGDFVLDGSLEGRLQRLSQTMTN